MLSILESINSESFVFNDCEFEDSTFVFKNKHVLFLVFSGGNLNNINISIRKMKQLRAYTAITPTIRNLPKWIFKLKELNYLNLTGNPINNLDDVIVKNKQLKELKLNECQLSYKDVYRIPKYLTGLVQLELDLNYDDCMRFKKEYDISKYKNGVCYD